MYINTPTKRSDGYDRGVRRGTRRDGDNRSRNDNSLGVLPTYTYTIRNNIRIVTTGTVHNII